MKTTIPPLAVVAFFLLVLHFTTAARLSCTLDSQCRRNFCIDNICQARRDVGQDCTQDSHCFSPAYCGSGKCAPCASDLTYCGSSGCADLQNDDDYCGSCDNACDEDNTHCYRGSCSCDTYYGDCDKDFETNGCEVYLNGNNDDYCGSCDNACGGADGYDSFCVEGSCKCNSGYGDCDETYDNGCEKYLNGDDDYCGSCNTKCGGAGNFDSYCFEGSCKCNSGYGNCDGNYDNGCEEYLNSNTYCGSCDNKCGGTFSFSSYCYSKSCKCTNLGTYYNCNNNYADGCEKFGSCPL